VQRGGHRLTAGLIDVPGVDARSVDFSDRPGQRMIANSFRQFGAAVVGKFFGVVQADDAAVLG